MILQFCFEQNLDEAFLSSAGNPFQTLAPRSRIEFSDIEECFFETPVGHLDWPAFWNTDEQLNHLGKSHERKQVKFYH